MAVTWNDPVTCLPSVGDKTAATLHRAGIKKIGDLLNYLPTRFEDTRKIITVAQLWEYMQEHGLPALAGKVLIVIGRVSKPKLIRLRGRRLTIVQASLYDHQDKEQAVLPLTWFNQPYLETSLVEDSLVVIKGQLRAEKNKIVMYPVDFERYYPGKKLLHVGRLTPVYRQTAGISTKLFRRWLHAALGQLRLNDPLPASWLKKYQLLPLVQAYQAIHEPRQRRDMAQGLSRLATQELLELHANFSLLKRSQRQRSDTVNLSPLRRPLQSFIRALPFKLTPDQQKIKRYWLEQLGQNQPLDCLLCGDVGSGKTIAVFLFALLLLLAGKSVVIIAPTSILAEQHRRTMTAWLALVPPLAAMPVTLVTARTRRVVIPNQPGLVIGTQALLYRQQLPPQTGLLVVDEQHKFGVEQRRQLLAQLQSDWSAKGQVTPHVITLSATPIPRTMALHVYGYQNALYINTLPQNRLRTETHLVPSNKMDDLYDWVIQQVAKTETQVYIVYPLVHDSDDLDITSAEIAYQELVEKLAPLRVGLLHGQLKAAQKEVVIEQFRQRKLDVLVTTTVIEVGVDVPNANIMIIHYPERYGLAQLHQLRGRVGRSDQQGYCYLATNSLKETPATSRLQYFSQHTNGWDVAEYDLRHRGAGELYGQLQAGASELRIASSYNSALIAQSITLWEEMQKNSLTVKQRFFLPPITA